MRYAPLAIPLLFVLNDAAVFRLDLFIECLARLGMIVLAAIVLRGWSSDARYRRQRIYLFWGLIGFSLDLYWQFAYEWHVAWLAMTIKFAGIALGTACFIALCASFANGRRASRAFTLVEHILAPACALFIFVTGIILGYTWQMGHCAGTLGGCFVDDPLALASNRAYFAADAFGRMTIVLTGIAALIASPENRQRLLLVAISCIVLGAGTAADFALRLIPLPGYAVFGLQLADATCTLLFVIGLFVAITRGRIFDVAFASSRALVYGVTFLVLFIAYEADLRVLIFIVAGLMLAAYLIYLRERGGSSRRAWTYAVATAAFYAGYFALEGRVHNLLDAPFERFLRWLSLDVLPGPAVDLAVGAAIALVLAVLLSPIEELGVEKIAESLMAEDGKRAQRLRNFRRSITLFTQAAELERMLVDTVFSAAQAEFAHLFHRNGHRFAASVSAPPSVASPPEIDEKALPKTLQPPALRDGPLPDTCGLVCEYAALMPLRGQLLGFLGLGRKQCRDGSCYSTIVLKELHALAHEAAKILHELRGEA
ncbi:MAG: hypothetical protein JO322_12335 [Candidatus Eremiobacteraeota bacterium]|nr:hypothetical protein [Candidatus Eremiobacteraeota bacterium]